MNPRIRILGISGSPRSNSNTTILVEAALKGAERIGEVETEFVSLHGKKINPCVACYQCPVEETICVQRDDMTEIYPRLFDADGIILGAPVYFGTINAQTKALMDRCRPFGLLGRPLQFKVGGAIAVGGGRHSGQEAAIQAIRTFFIMSRMLQVGSVTGPIGVGGLAWEEGAITRDTWFSEIRGQESTIDVARELGKLVAVATKIVVAGKQIIQLDKYNLNIGGLKSPAEHELK